MGRHQDSTWVALGRSPMTGQFQNTELTGLERWPPDILFVTSGTLLTALPSVSVCPGTWAKVRVWLRQEGMRKI